MEHISVPLNRDWFYADPEKYLNRPDFMHLEEISNVNLRDVISNDPVKVRSVQQKWTEQSIILNEIQKQHFGFPFPFFVYTHSYELFEPVKYHNPVVDEFILSWDMCDSLRRRHIALSYGLIPHCIDLIQNGSDRPLTVKNLGSGVGLDVIQAIRNGVDGRVETVLNYDVNEEALSLGKKIVAHLEDRGELNRGTVKFIPKSLTKSDEQADLIIMIGIICGLKDFAAIELLSQVHRQLPKGGILLISSSNHNMESTDPVANFTIQHVGTRNDSLKGWGLNFRTEEKMRKVLGKAGFDNFKIYHDADFPGKEKLSEEIMLGIDTLPAEMSGYHHPGKPLSLPSQENLNRGVGYNWLAIATK